MSETEQTVRAIKAEAWDEGFTRGFYDGLAGGPRDASESSAVNPYDDESVAVSAARESAAQDIEALLDNSDTDADVMEAARIARGSYR